MTPCRSCASCSVSRPAWKWPSPDAGARHVGDQLEPVALLAYELVARGPVEVVQLRCGRDEKAAALEHVGLCPGQPALEQRPQPRLAARSLERRAHDPVHEQLGRVAQRLDLERLLRVEVREEPALREPELARQLPDREAVETAAAGRLRRALEDQLPGLAPLAHHPKFSTIVRFVNGWRPSGCAALSARRSSWSRSGAAPAPRARRATARSARADCTRPSRPTRKNAGKMFWPKAARVAGSSAAFG